MKILIIDGQGGGLGRQLVSAVRERYPEIEILAVGTNSAATNAMLRAGADQAATGENSVAVASERADVIMGPVGIVIADSMLGEITPRMALSVGQSRAKRILIPVNLCDNIVVGVTEISMTKNVQNAVEALGALNNGLTPADLKAGAMIRVPGKSDDTAPGTLAEESRDSVSSSLHEMAESAEFKALRRSEVLDIALLLPLTTGNKTAANPNYLEFYQGFLLGLEELKEQGRGAVNLTLYNTAHDQLKVQQIVGSEGFASTDLIVGPVYEDELKPVVDFAEANGVPVVSPLANLSAVESPTLFQLAPAAENKYDKIDNLIDGGRDIYLIYASANDGEFEKEILAELEGKPRYSYTYSYNQRSIFTPRDASSPAISDMADVLKGERPCLFIVLANSETDVDRILGTISSANTSIVERGTKSAQYVVLGTSRWGRFNNIDHTSFFNNNVVMISTYHAKRDSEAVRDFDSRYIETYGMLPSLYSYRGYDAAMIFVAGMRSDIEYRMLDKRYAPLQTEYKFRQTGEGGRYVNQEWMRVNYNSNYTITHE